LLAKKFKCADIGMNCNYEATADTHQDLMAKIADHAKSAHGMTEIPKDVLAKVQAAIKEI
jgi:predicted small metal-binding protein